MSLSIMMLISIYGILSARKRSLNWQASIGADRMSTPLYVTLEVAPMTRKVLRLTASPKRHVRAIAAMACR